MGCEAVSTAADELRRTYQGKGENSAQSPFHRRGNKSTDGKGGNLSGAENERRAEREAAFDDSKTSDCHFLHLSFNISLEHRERERTKRSDFESERGFWFGD